MLRRAASPYFSVNTASAALLAWRTLARPRGYGFILTRALKHNIETSRRGRARKWVDYRMREDRSAPAIAGRESREQCPKHGQLAQALEVGVLLDVAEVIESRFDGLLQFAHRLGAAAA